ncbi:MAG: HNH endonuclease signature motif containing protein [Sulfurimonas sp.]
MNKQGKSIKQADVNWSKVTLKTNKSKSFKEYELEFEDGQKITLNFEIKYKIYKYSDENQSYYQRIIELPFAVQSDWTITCPGEKEILTLFKSKLKQKYKDILTRDYNNIEYFEKFKGIAGELVDKKTFSSDLHHKPYIDKINGKAIGYIWKELYPQKKYTFSEVKDTDYEKKLSWEKFVKMMIEDNCAYCGVSIEQINNMKLFTKRSRGYTLEVDQKDPYGNYTDENCVACCYWCNNAKTDEFLPSEFKEIARGINKTWNQRLKKSDSTETICFPENSDIWKL